jgi:hypothetical protein
MKITFSKIMTLVVLLSGLTMSSCKKDAEPLPNPGPSTTYIELTGDLPTQTLDPSKKYLLKGYAFVQAGQTLTIPAGTIIFGDKASKGTLVINRGGKIMAEGTAEKPIVFTSKFGPGDRDKGDWGGIIILGNANVNQQSTPIEGVTPSVNFGTFQSTANDNESSGVLKYVRIEYAGIALSPNNEINGLTFGGVGSGTVVENVQVSYSGDDAFEWFGGTVNCKKLIAFGTWDDDFDTDLGYTGKVQFALALRDPFNADQSGSNCFESDNDGGGNDVTPKTAPVFSNVTIIGPRDTSVSPISSNYRNAVHFRRNTATSLFNSVISGFPTGILMDGTSTFGNYEGNSPKGEIKSNLILSPSSSALAVAGGVVSDNFRSYFTSNNPAEILQPSQAKYNELGLEPGLFFGKSGNAASYPANPSFSVSSDKFIGSSAQFSSPKLTDPFFQQVNHLGAFDPTDWTDGWATFDPKNQVYP